ncbi:MAG TPA: NnrU family protein [Amaricoccus sp.]|uniref:NnrU family protein n=1 Tax=Amaricoccus sp. TaxID=1872485 RepID=UPI002CC46033|nr:NnrU family protein [Amaricoccus sp.]HMQ93570.1 NnrU family protein [Amaricoccus sp.]HMR53177.1 NnrU family protein [Amaricoccus sp.]HMR62103.1 NnrU family protein [Amaricoccus sp.]HMU00073.1 NnrU family protein [Amaricoccus sp.]
MSGWLGFALAYAAFLLSHAIPMRPRVKAGLASAFGQRGYLVGYVAVSIALLAWLIHAANDAPYVPLWSHAPWQRWVPNLAMPLVCLLVAFALGAPNPLSFGGARAQEFDPDRPGIAGVARHPILWALALWAGAHLVPNGDLAHGLLFGGFTVMAFSGMRAIDRRNRRRLGEDPWRRLAARTSTLPLAALIGGRWRPRGLPDLRRITIAVAAWATLLALHRPIIGVSPLP